MKITAKGVLAVKLLQTKQFSGLSDPKLEETISRILKNGPSNKEEQNWLDEINGKREN